MSLLWRISGHCDLLGMGGELSAGRWHTAALGRRIVYLSEHPALSLLETIVNLKGDPRRVPLGFQLLKVTVPDIVRADSVDRAILGHGWEAERRGTQLLGNAWLDSAKSALLRVPAVCSPESMNYLLNPLHPDAGAIKVEWCRWITYDQRLFGFAER